jgi:thiazolylpeptide-type bacteriocin precursor
MTKGFNNFSTADIAKYIAKRGKVMKKETLMEELFADIEDMDFVEINEATALPETAATSGSMIGNGCSTCGSSSCCSS